MNTLELGGEQLPYCSHKTPVSPHSFWEWDASLGLLIRVLIWNFGLKGLLVCPLLGS